MSSATKTAVESVTAVVAVAQCGADIGKFCEEGLNSPPLGVIIMV